MCQLAITRLQAPFRSGPWCDVLTKSVLRLLPDQKRGDPSFVTWMLFIRRIPMIPRARQNRQFQVSGEQKSQFPHSDPTKIAISIDFLEKNPITWHAMAPPGAATNGADLAPPKLLLPRSTNQHGDYGQWGLHQTCLACFFGGI